MDEVHWHRGHKIVLTPGVKDNGRWACQYLVIKFGNEQMGSRNGYPPSDSATKEEVMSAALEEAKKLAGSEAWQQHTIEYGPMEWENNEQSIREDLKRDGWEVVGVREPPKKHVYEVTVKRIEGKP